MKILLSFLCLCLISLSPKEMRWIGEKVFRNECSDETKCLITWNEGEDFMSLGIGHFIWYPAGEKENFEQSFPRLIEYLKALRTPIPRWLDTSPVPPCPWNSREDFLLNEGVSQEALELRKFLSATKTQQTAFLIKHLQEALPKMAAYAAEGQRPHIIKQFDRIAATPEGVFALTDYINFKGLGLNPTERYRSQGWGLFHVLSTMKGDRPGAPALEEFVSVARELLIQRVKNAPSASREKKWLAGWLNRIDSYLKP